MGVTCNTSKDEFTNLILAIETIAYEEVNRTLSYLGEQCVAKIRDRSPEESWYDQTANLRSSIGYAVYNHGKKQIQSTFETVLGGTLGSSTGRSMVNQLVSKYSQVYALVVLAGMNYADMVEARDNKDVLASTELWARGMVDSYLKKTEERISQRLAKL